MVSEEKMFENNDGFTTDIGLLAHPWAKKVQVSQKLNKSL